MKRLRRLLGNAWLPTAMLAAPITLWTVTAVVWKDKFSIIFLGLFSFVFLGLMVAWRRMADSSLKTSQEILEDWKAETVFAQDLLEQAQQMLNDLYRVNPALGTMYATQLKESMRKRHPDIVAQMSEFI